MLLHVSMWRKLLTSSWKSLNKIAQNCLSRCFVERKKKFPRKSSRRFKWCHTMKAGKVIQQIFILISSFAIVLLHSKESLEFQHILGFTSNIFNIWSIHRNYIRCACDITTWLFVYKNMTRWRLLLCSRCRSSCCR